MQQVFSNSQTVQVFLYCVKKQAPVGVREAQRDLGIKSSSSIHWHLNKLLDAQILKKEPNNTYALTEIGKKLDRITFPVDETFLVMRGELISHGVFQVAFLVTALITGISLFFWNPLISAIFSLQVVIVEAIIQARVLMKRMAVLPSYQS